MQDALIDASTRIRPEVRPGVTLALAFCVAQLMLILDFSIVNVALPAIEAELQASASRGSSGSSAPMP